MHSPESSPELDDTHPHSPAEASIPPSEPHVDLARFLEAEEERKRRRDQETTNELAAASARATSPQRRKAERAHAMDIKWESIRSDWGTQFPDHPLPIMRPTADNSPFPQRPPVQSLPSSRDLSSVLSTRRGIAMPRASQGTGGSKPRTPPLHGFSHHPLTPHLPPSPLGKISDDQVSYFSGVAESLNGTSPSEGMVIQSPDGRPAIFFQPQKTHRSTSGSHSKSSTSRAMERDRDLPAAITDPSTFTMSPVAGPGEATNTPPIPATPGIGGSARVAAPHEIGLGGRRKSSNASSHSGESGSPLPVGTPALTLDSFIAKSRGHSEENVATAVAEDASPPAKRGSTPGHLSRRESQTSNTSGSNGRSASHRPSIGNSPRVSGLPPIERRNASAPPLSPRVDENSPLVVPPPAPTPIAPLPQSSVNTPATTRHREFSNPNSPKAGHSRRVSGLMSNGTSRRAKAPRRATLPTVPPIDVLIVEDNIINQRILSKFMQSKGIKYAVAKDGEEAVQKWKQGSFHLVLMDIQLPVKDGIEATRDIREIERISNVGTLISTPTSDRTSPFASLTNSPTSPPLSMPVIIVALTASSLQVDRVSALAAGCNDFLTKPVSLPWLQQKLLEWGSMAYLSGFSRHNSDKDCKAVGHGDSANSSPAFSASLNTKAADAISAHLHIDRRLHPRGSSPARPHIDTGAQRPSPLPPTAPDVPNPELTFTTPTPALTPHVDAAAKEASDAETVALSDEAVPDLGAVDSRLESVKAEGQVQQRRPGPSPLSMGAEHMSLDDVLSEGARLAETARTRANSYARDSFSLVMADSGISTPLPRSPQPPSSAL